MKHIVLVFFGSLLIAPPTNGQDTSPKKEDKPVQTAVRFLTEMNIASLTIDVKPLGEWIKPALEKIDQRFKDEKSGREVQIQITLHKTGEPEVIVAGSPALKEAETAELRAMLDLPKAPHTKVVDVVFRIETKINGGDPDPSHSITPKLLDPFEALRQKLVASSLDGQAKLFREWAKTSAIPVLAGAAVKADPKFEGVVNLGKTLEKLDLNGPVNVEALTERNPDFWRATMEMAPGIPLTPAIRVALHTLNGEFDKARRISEIARPFDANKSAASRVLGEFFMLNQAFSKALNDRVYGGIALHDKGEFAQAIAIYDSVLRDVPKSAWPIYERFHSQRSVLMAEKKDVKEVNTDWPEARKKIYGADPLYQHMASASGPDEFYELSRRLKIGTLFKDPKKRGPDMLEYAAIARDLNQDGYAALIYWYAFSQFPAELREGHDLLEDFLYSLDRLGVKDFKSQFKGDHAAAFAKIDAERKKQRDEDPIRKKAAQPK